MNTAELAEKVAAAQGLSKADARKYVDAVIETIAATVAAGEEVNISGFGKFVVKSSPEREGRNPATGATMTIAASKKPAFSALKAFKDRVNV